MIDIEKTLSRDYEPPVIKLENVSKDYQDGQHALKNVSLEVKKGEFVFVVGSSGSGKSTLIKLLLKEISPNSGKVFVAGRDVSHLHHSAVAKHRRNIGIVFQDFRLLPDRTVYENVAGIQFLIHRHQPCFCSGR